MKSGSIASDTVDLADYEHIRLEINNRTAISAQLLNYNLIAVGAVIFVFKDVPYPVIAAIACAPNILWLMWLDHTSQIFKLAAYFEIQVVTRLRRRYPETMGWGRFMRLLDLNSDSARLALFGNTIRSDANDNMRFLRTQDVALFIALMFLGSYIFLMCLFFVKISDSYSKPTWRVDPLLALLDLNTWIHGWPLHDYQVRAIFAFIALVVNTITFVFALCSHLRFMRLQRTIAQAILLQPDYAASE